MSLSLIIDILGWIGGGMVVLAYTLISLKIVKADNFYYQVLNVLGAFLLIINTWFHKAYPSAIVNIIWVAIALYTILKFRSDKNGK